MLLLVALVAQVSAKSDTAAPEAEAKSPFERLAVVDSAIEAVDKHLALENLTQAQLLEIKERLVPLEDELAAIVGELEPYIEGIDARLEQLGKAPGPDDPPEDPNVAADREQETKKRQEWDDALKRSKILQLRERELVADVAKHRRQMFSAELSARTTSILGLTYWRAVLGNIPIDARRFELRYREGVAALSKGLTGEARTHLAFLCLLGLAIAIAGPLLGVRVGEKLALRWLPDNRLRRTLVALWTVIVFVALPVLGASLVADAVEGTPGLTPFMATMVATSVAVVRIVALITGLARAWLQPRCPQWRLVWWSDAQVARLRGFPMAIAILVACRVVLERANDNLGTSLHVSILGRTVFALAILCVFAVALARLGAIRHELIANPPPRLPGGKAHNPVPAALVSSFAWILVLVAPIALVLGYNALAIFIVSEITQVGVVLAALFLLMRLVDDIFEAVLSEHFPLGRLLRRSIGFSAAYIDQIAVVLAAVSRVALVYVAARLVLLRLGGEDVTSVAGRIQDGLADLKVGEVTISPGAIVGALLVFGGVWLLTRTVRRWLENSYLPHTSLDSGARNSLSTGIGYLGFVGAVLMAVAYLGVSLDKVALIASALSVGVGFGLQAIISNFVSGLILLVERPIKVGDLVNVSGTTGDVKKISVRATEILLGDGSTYVVPNSDLISKPVVNKTRLGVRGQVQFLLRIAYGEDPNRTREVILDEAAKLEKLLRDPKPAVFIDDVDDRGYVLNIVANVASPRDTYGAKSDLFFAITKRLRAERIALGSPITSVASDEGSASAEQTDTEVETTAEEPAAEPPPSSTEDTSERPALGDGKGAGS
ncbi:MAG: DUF3772 domain-containing protein [Myxococcota bacterium]